MDNTALEHPLEQYIHNQISLLKPCKSNPSQGLVFVIDIQISEPVSYRKSYTYEEYLQLHSQWTHADPEVAFL